METLDHIIRDRFVELGHALRPISASELATRFSCAEPPPGGLHFVLELAGVPIAYSVWSMPSEEVIDAFTSDAQNLRADGRVLVTIINFMGSVEVRSRMLAATEPPVAASILDAEMRAALPRVWDDSRAQRRLRAEVSS